MSELKRFLKAQKYDYLLALKEVKKGKKYSCWMWYIFPQIKGLGNNPFSQYYEIKDMKEAIEYLKHKTLKHRLLEISKVVYNLENDDIVDVFGDIDSLKLKSSMTLFNIAEKLSGVDCNKIFEKVLDKFYNGEKDINTLKILEKQRQKKFKYSNNNSNYMNNNIDNENNKNNNKNKNIIGNEDNMDEDIINKCNIDNMEYKDNNNQNNNYNIHKKNNDNVENKDYIDNEKNINNE